MQRAAPFPAAARWACKKVNSLVDGAQPTLCLPGTSNLRGGGAEMTAV